MKRFFTLIFLVTAIFLAGCQSDLKLDSMTFYSDDGSIPPQYFSRSTLKLVPDYEKRELMVSYERVFPNRTEETTEDDFKADKLEIGGAFFEGFEEIAGDYENGGIDKVEQELDNRKDVCVGGVNFSIEFAVADSVKKYELPLCGEIENTKLKNLQQFFQNIVTIISQDVY